MPFRIEVERLKRVEADLAAARGASGNGSGRGGAVARSRPYMVWHFVTGRPTQPEGRRSCGTA
jgi:hypothetical protein